MDESPANFRETTLVDSLGKDTGFGVGKTSKDGYMAGQTKGAITLPKIGNALRYG